MVIIAMPVMVIVSPTIIDMMSLVGVLIAMINVVMAIKIEVA